MTSIQKLKSFFSPELKNEIWVRVRDSSYIIFPQILFFCCLYLQFSINLFFISLKYKDNTLINAVGISHIYTNVTTTVVFYGIADALDTLASNAYGKNNYRLIGAYFDRCRLISLAFFGVIITFHSLCSRSLLKFLKVEDVLMETIVGYVKIYSLAQCIQVNFQMNSKLFVLLEKSYLNLYLSVSAMIVHSLCCGFFIYICDLGIKGGSISFLITAFFNTITSTVVSFRLGLPQGTLVFFSREGLQDWFEYFRFAAPNIFMNLGEWVGYEIQGIMAIYITSQVYTTYILVINLESLTFPYTYGISVAVGMKTGERLMTTASSDLKRFVTILYAFSFLLSLLVLVIVYFIAGPFFSIMAPDELIYEKCCKVIPFIMSYVLFTNGYYVYMHVLKGIGYLVNPTIATFAVFYLVQIGFTYLFVFVYDFEVRGIYSSLTIGSLMCFLIFAYWVYSKDLDQLKQNAEMRVDNAEKVIARIEMKPIVISNENEAKINDNSSDNRTKFLE